MDKVYKVDPCGLYGIYLCDIDQGVLIVSLSRIGSLALLYFGQRSRRLLVRIRRGRNYLPFARRSRYPLQNAVIPGQRYFTAVTKNTAILTAMSSHSGKSQASTIPQRRKCVNAIKLCIRYISHCNTLFLTYHGRRGMQDLKVFGILSGGRVRRSY